ncbi:PIN domain-like protein [Suillus subalutaceus]|uniref:PIN domain-like protein n=1 Tax=Suillus subalutaceus TaxID=48586 RepID=UPI001B8756E3|nr:PIN domain-like protein [Suillus subalutaceus]KAG1855337.1 PIN domain-like protein [Suillus subalutaceus]
MSKATRCAIADTEKPVKSDSPIMAICDKSKMQLLCNALKKSAGFRAYKMENNITKDLAKFSLANTIYAALIAGGQVTSEPTPFYSPPFKPDFCHCLLPSRLIMGIHGLWERVTLSAENRTLKELTVSELKTEGVEGNCKLRLFTIGIDASLWMHSVCAVFRVNHAGAGKSPELWTLFFRLWTLLKLPLHAVFVFDGLERLPDKGRKCMLELFGFDWTQAPSEAEAEPAAMNVHSVIDACKNDKDYLNVQVFTEDGLEHGCSLTRGDWLLIALLAGGDYDRSVPGCGIEIVHKVALHSKIGQMMLNAFLSMTLDEFSERAEELVEDLHTLLSTDPYNFLECRYKVVADRIPHSFPQHAVVSKYVHAFTSFSATRNGTVALPWDVSFHQPDLASLADFCRQHLGWEDDAIIEKMYGGVWEGACLCALCKPLTLPKYMPTMTVYEDPAFKDAFETIPNRCSNKVLALYMSLKGFHENLSKTTVESIRSAFKKMWELSDGDTYHGKWHFNEAKQHWEGNPTDSTDIYDVLSSIKHKASAEGGDQTHSMAMTKDYMDRAF